MNRTHLLTVSALLIALAAAFYFGVRRTSDADLVPVVDGRPGVGYAKTEPLPDGSGIELVIFVKNQGLDVIAPASITTVRFNGQTFDKATGSIAPDATEELRVEVPRACWSSFKCDFEIELDSRHQVRESDENNNKVSGQLLG